MGLEDVSQRGEEFKDIHRKSTSERRGGLFFPLIGSTIAGVALSTLLGIWLVAVKGDYSAMQTVNKSQQTAAYSMLHNAQNLLSEKCEELGKKKKEIQEKAEEKSNLDKLLEQIREDFKKAQETIKTQKKDIEVKAGRITDLELETTSLTERLGDAIKDIETAQANYQALDKKYGELETSMRQLEEINKRLKGRLETSSAKKRKLIELDEVFIKSSDRYFSLIKKIGATEVEELKWLRGDLLVYQKQFADLNPRNLKTLIESINAIVKMKGYHQTLQTELDEKKKYAEDWAYLVERLKKCSEKVKSQEGDKIHNLSLLKLALAFRPKYSPESGSKETEDKNKERNAALDHLVTIVSSLYDVEVDLKDLNKRYATLKDEDKDKTQLAEQITGLEGQVRGLTSQLDAKKKEVEAKAKEAQGYLDALETLRTSSKKVEEERKNARIRLAAEEKRATDNEKKYETAEADRKKAVERLEVLTRTLEDQFKTYETVWSSGIKQGKAMPFNMVAVAALAAELASKKAGNDKEGAIYNRFISLVGKMEEAYKMVGARIAYLDKRFTDIQKEYDDVLVNGFARAVREGETVRLHFDMTYDHKPDEEKLMRLGYKFDLALAKKLGLIEILTDYPGKDQSPADRLKERLEKIAQTEKQWKKKFKHFYVGYSLENANSSVPYYIGEVYEGDPQHVVIWYTSKKNVANFIKHVIMKR